MNRCLLNVLKNMKAIFTIISENYLPLAWTLMDSISATNEEPFDLFVVLADVTKENIKNIKHNKKYNITYLSGEEIFPKKEMYLELAFKYDVTEFCTSLKPYTFLKLEATEKYDGIIYFDPDFYIYSPISDVFEILQNKLCVVTPHYYNIEEEHSGYVPETVILFAGIFNFGFFAINSKHKNSNQLLKWWAQRLTDGAYHDKIDAYHTDQKWMDFLPTYFGDDVHIIRKPGYNLAIWNLHQRELKKIANDFLVADKNKSNFLPLSFIHFAGFDYNNIDVVHKHYLDVPSSKFPVLRELMGAYKEHLKQNGFEDYIKIPYKFNFFENNVAIIKFHRRLFRAALYNENLYNSPFNTDNDSFYSELRNKKLLVKKNTDKLNEQNFTGINSKIIILNKFFNFIKRVIGFEKYSLLIKFLSRFSRFENQFFLLKGVKSTYYVNENRNKKIN